MVNNPGPAAISSPSHDRRGMWLVVGLVGLGLALAAVGVWFQWGQTRRCLVFYGSTQAERISTAPRVELWTLQGGRTGNVAAVDQHRAVHLPELLSIQLRHHPSHSAILARPTVNIRKLTVWAPTRCTRADRAQAVDRNLGTVHAEGIQICPTTTHLKRYIC